MAKLTKHAENLDQLMKMVHKQAAEADRVKSSADAAKDKEPHSDVKPNVNSFKAESTNQKDIDQNAVKAEANKPQGIDQMPGKAAEVQALADDIFDSLKKETEKMDKESADAAKDKEPHADVKANVNSFKAESTAQKDVDQNAVKAEANKPQGIDQMPGKAAADATRIAEYDYARKVAASLYMSMNKQASVVDNIELLKMAGRRDFEDLVQGAIAQHEKLSKAKQVKTAAVVEPEMDAKQAEELGAQYFQHIRKQAEADLEKDELLGKIAELEQKLEAHSKVASEVKSRIDQSDKQNEKEASEREFAQKIASLIAPSITEAVSKEVVERLKRESA